MSVVKAQDIFTPRYSVLLTGLTLVFFLWPGSAWAASGNPSAAEVTRTLNLAALQGSTPRTLWNMGMNIFLEYPPSKSLALAIAQGYERAKATKAEQDEAFRQAARFWRLKYEY
ncbi:MAG: hypothetical protein HQK55_09135, partial [Deltaproteobacteria bacterium]|nr:hypothetical protein [Deltaproteobacteria bacterium]